MFKYSLITFYITQEQAVALGFELRPYRTPLDTDNTGLVVRGTEVIGYLGRDMSSWSLDLEGTWEVTFTPRYQAVMSSSLEEAGSSHSNSPLIYESEIALA